MHGITDRIPRASSRASPTSRTSCIEFIGGAELVIHNAAFDVAFLDAEFARLPEPASAGSVRDVCAVLDTLALARQMHPGQRNSLDALCKRYGVDNSQRELHGALLDAELLLDVYLAMTGGQGALTLDDRAPRRRRRPCASARRASEPACCWCGAPPTTELAAHERMLDVLDKASGGKTAWRTVSRRALDSRRCAA